jgi:large subunit ribosomal protein L21
LGRYWCFYPQGGAIIIGSLEILPWKFLQSTQVLEYEEVNMYAVIKTGGKQYRVASGEKIKVEQIAADVGQEIVIDQVLAVGNGAELKVGTPLVSGATVKATVVAHGKHDKVHIFKMRRRKHYQKRQGHRQQFTELQIGDIAA